MKKGLIRKGLVFSVIVLFIGLAVIPSTGIILGNKSLNIGNSSGFIQNLIDNASNGDTIYIPSGTYYENLIINKSISLVGEDKDTTIIDGSRIGDVIFVSVDLVNITGFTLRRSGEVGYPQYDSGVDLVGSKECTISDNIFIGNKIGVSIRANQGSRNHITNNTIKKSGIYGIMIYRGSSNIISYNNIIDDNNIAIDLYHANNNDIICNTISGNREGIQIHVYSHETYVYGNNIENNSDYGIEIHCSKNNISYNNIKNNYLNIYISYDSENHEFNNNNFIVNKFNIDCKTSSHTFNNNYWNRPRFFPKLILGLREIQIEIFGSKVYINIPKFMFDLNPSLVPNELPCV